MGRERLSNHTDVLGGRDKSPNWTLQPICLGYCLILSLSQLTILISRQVSMHTDYHRSVSVHWVSFRFSSVASSITMFPSWGGLGRFQSACEREQRAAKPTIRLRLSFMLLTRTPSSQQPTCTHSGNDRFTAPSEPFLTSRCLCWCQHPAHRLLHTVSLRATTHSAGVSHASPVGFLWQHTKCAEAHPSASPCIFFTG